jgi:hypothetical protein
MAGRRAKLDLDVVNSYLNVHVQVEPFINF